MALIHRIVFNGPIDKTGAGEDDLGLAIELAAGHEEMEVAPAVDVQVQEGGGIAVHITHLRGQIKDVIRALHHSLHQVKIPDVPFDKVNLVQNRLKVKTVA